MREGDIRVPRRSVVLVVSLVVAIAIGEGLVRVVGNVPRVHALSLSDPGSAYRRSTNPLLGYELKPSFEAHLGPGRTTTNTRGLRDREHALPKPEGVRRVALVGDSVVELVNYLADEDTLARRLERLYPDGDVEVINVGTSGYCTVAQIELLESRGLQYEPDVVVVVFVNNDFQNFNPDHALDSAIRRPWLAKQLFLRSHLFRLAALRLDLWSFRTETDPAAGHPRAPVENNVVTGLRKLRVLAEARGFLPVIAIWPEFTTEAIIDGPWMPEAADELIVERLARMFGIPSARLSEAFRAHLHASPQLFDPRARYTARADGMHPSVEGARVAAAGLRSILARLPSDLPPRGADDAPAIEAARRAGSAPPGRRPMKERIFFVLMQQYRVEEAEAYLRQLLDEDPNDHFARYRLGAELLRRERVVEAIRELEHASRIRPDDVETLLRLGIAHAEQGDWNAAESLYERVLSIDPGHREALGDLEQVRRLRLAEAAAGGS